MSRVLEITQLDNGDIVLRETDEGGEPLISVRFSEEVREMLNQDLIGVAEAMIDAATDYLGGEPVEEEIDNSEEALEPPPVIH
jgi:hypothetical protein